MSDARTSRVKRTAYDFSPLDINMHTLTGFFGVFGKGPEAMRKLKVPPEYAAMCKAGLVRAGQSEQMEELPRRGLANDAVIKKPRH